MEHSQPVKKQRGTPLIFRQILKSQNVQKTVSRFPDFSDSQSFQIFRFFRFPDFSDFQIFQIFKFLKFSDFQFFRFSDFQILKKKCSYKNKNSVGHNFANIHFHTDCDPIKLIYWSRTCLQTRRSALTILSISLPTNLKLRKVPYQYFL